MVRLPNGVFIGFRRRSVDVIFDVYICLPVERRPLVTRGGVFPPTAASATSTISPITCPSLEHVDLPVYFFDLPTESQPLCTATRMVLGNG